MNRTEKEVEALRAERAANLAQLDALSGDAPSVLLATGKLVGEGFDHPPLDTLILAMPISWKGTLQQYAGRLHRQHAGKHSVRIFDFVDTGHPALLRMWKKRERGYRAMGSGRNAPFSEPPAQIPACATGAPGSHLGSLTSRHALFRAAVRTRASRWNTLSRR